MVIITGASRGIGKFLFEKFWELGEIVYGTYNLTNPETDKMDYYTKVDISNYSDVLNWIEQIKDNLEKIVLINCAGINYNSLAHKADIEKWTNVINVNLIGTFNVIHVLLPIMRAQEYGRIINFSSVVGQIGVAGASPYAASKSGLLGLTKSIAKEIAKKGITINNLTLGYFNIGIIKEVPEEFKKEIKSRIPFGEFGNPENILKAVKFLIETDYINGSSIDLNAGLF
jgi:acetoacetyl-CoA reductase/3-oxoacyl-[acyl-carrier protein] reductase